jgi:hypothetical protein
MVLTSPRPVGADLRNVFTTPQDSAGRGEVPPE